jgi:signal transduction histidine kinase
VAVKTFLDLAPSKLKEEHLDMGQLRNPDFWKDYYQNVQKQIERITNMLKDLWIVSEDRRFEFNDTIALQPFVNGIIEKLKEPAIAKKITIENKLSENLPALQVDKPKFTRLFELLIKDEIVSLPEGSKITIGASANSANPDEIDIEVADNGPGLPKEALRLIFDPFVVRSDSPMEYGINLMACYFIVHHHGGKIEAKSDEGQGTVFSIKLMLNPNHPSASTQNTEFLQKVLLNDTVWENMLKTE